ncbi:hypothetical protein Tco_0287708 [Tanacetum coccineum]
MKDIFEELEAEVDQNAINKKHDEIKRKNILIAHDNLIADCLSKDMFYIATNSKLTISRFTEMHDAHTIVQARCLELEAELFNLRDKLKYQNFKEIFGNNPPPPARVTPDFDSVFVIEKMKASLQGEDNAIKKLKIQISQLKETRNEADQQNELFRAENEKVKQHYKELYDSIKITHAKHIEQITAVLTENENLKAQIHNKMKYVTKDHVKPTVLTPGKYAIDVEPIPPRNRNNREVHLDYLKHLKESVETLREIVEEAKVERPLDRSIVSACRYTKHSQELLEYATTKYLYVCPAVGSTCADTMADMNIHVNDAPTEQAPAIAPPTRTDDQILPSSKWVPISKSNCVLDVQKSQRNPIFPLAVAILKNTNFFRAFTASSTISAIYIQRDALDITPTNDDNPFVTPPSSDTVIEYVNTLGYPNTLRNVSAMFVNALYQPWRAILSMINMCLTGKTAGYDRPRHPVLQILWGIIHRSNIDYAERIWEEFVQSIQTFLTDRKNLTTASRGKKKTAHLLIPNVRFTKLIIHHLKTKHNIHPRTGSALHYSHEENVLNTLRYVGKDGREIFGMPIPDALLTDTIKRAPYYNGYLEHVAEYQRYLDEEHDKADDKTPKPTSSQPSKPIPTPTEPSQKDQGKKRKLVKETSDAPSPAKRSKAGKVTKKRMPKSPLKLVNEHSDEDVQGKGKEKVVDEQDAHDLLTLQTPKKKCPADQFIFQRRTPMPIEASGHAESPSLDAELALTDSEMESDNEVSKINSGDQDEGQARPNPSNQDEDQSGPNPGDQDEG